MNILTKDKWIMRWWGIQHRYTPNDREYVFVGQKQCVGHTVSTQNAGKRQVTNQNRSFKDCMPDINFVWILVIDNSGLDQPIDFSDSLYFSYRLNVASI